MFQDVFQPPPGLRWRALGGAANGRDVWEIPYLPPLLLLSEHQQAVQCQASQMDFLIHLFAGTSLKLRPKGYLNAGVASDSRLSRPGETKDIRKARIMRCQAGHGIIVNYIYSCAAGTPPPCFQEYKAPSSCCCFGLSSGSSRSLMKSNKWEGGAHARAPRVHFKGTLRMDTSQRVRTGGR